MLHHALDHATHDFQPIGVYVEEGDLAEGDLLLVLDEAVDELRGVEASPTDDGQFLDA